MADLSFKKRMLRVCPDLLGNHESSAPFELEARRLTEGELLAFRERATEVRAALRSDDGASPETIAALFDGILAGPRGELRIDGEEITSLEPLFLLAAQEFPLDGGVLDGLIGAVLAANSLSERAAKNFERRRGGGGGTPATTPAASSSPSAADAAASSSSTAST